MNWTFVAIFAPAVAFGASAEADRARLIAQFDSLVAAEVESATGTRPTNDDGGIAWGQSYTLDALAEMLDVTRDAKYAELFVKLGDWVVGGRDDRLGLRDEYRGRVCKSWSSTRYTEGKRHVWAVHTGMIVAPMARFAAVVRRDPKLAGRFGRDADRFLATAEEAAAVHDGEYRDGPGGDEGHIYGVSTERHLPLNMQNALVRAWIAIDDARGTDGHRERIMRLARFFKNRLRTTGDDAYVWAYLPPLEGPGDGFEDISHASINVDFAVICFEHGFVFTGQDMDRFARTLLRKVMLGEKAIANTVGGTGGLNKYVNAVLRWGRLASHNEPVRTRLMALWRSGQAERASTTALGIAYLVRAGGTAATRPAAR